MTERTQLTVIAVASLIVVGIALWRIAIGEVAWWPHAAAVWTYCGIKAWRMRD